jgi:hypothetical protein
MTDEPCTSLGFFFDGCTLAVGGLYGNLLLYDLRHSNEPKMK